MWPDLGKYVPKLWRTTLIYDNFFKFVFYWTFWFGWLTLKMGVSFLIKRVSCRSYTNWIGVMCVIGDLNSILSMARTKTGSGPCSHQIWPPFLWIWAMLKLLSGETLSDSLKNNIKFIVFDTPSYLLFFSRMSASHS